MLPKVIYVVKLNALSKLSNRIVRSAITTDALIDAFRNLPNKNIDIKGEEIEKSLRYSTTKAIDAYISHIWSFKQDSNGCFLNHLDSQSVKRSMFLFLSLPSRFDITWFSKRLSATIIYFVWRWTVSKIPDGSWKCVKLYLTGISSLISKKNLQKESRKTNSEILPGHLGPKWYSWSKIRMMRNKLCPNKVNILSWIQNDVLDDLNKTVETAMGIFTLYFSCLIYITEQFTVL